MCSELWGKIKLIIFDFDGVFTDNRVLVDEEGREAVFCYRSDGIGLHMLASVGIKSLVVSTEANPVVKKRCEKLGIDCISGCKDKAFVIRELVRNYNIGLDEVAFVGNDVNDLEALKIVGFPICVNDAYPKVKVVCKYVTSRCGGWGAVREVCERLVESRSRN